ncbi:MAG: DUF4111 domain-containing protein [Acidimicrobiia bacterium]|nr:DUF4111 domain-containing protein [Acidimicrobiia bacterium]
MDATPNPELNGVLAELVGRTRDALGDALVGIYLQGSFALGDHDEHSDVDFIAVVDQGLEARAVAALTAMHEEIFTLPSEWARHLEGSYFPRDVLAHHGRSGEPVWYLDHGSTQLVLSDHCNTPVVRWIVREHGVPLVGPDPTTLMPPIPGDTLRKHMVSTILDWGAEIIADPTPSRNRFYQGFIVLNYCRMYHDLVTGRPSSKRVGATWAQEHLDPTWSGLIARSWGGRPNPAVSVTEAPDAEDFDATLRFVEVIMGMTEEWVRANDH